jgi:predicted dehydrogenase
VIETPPYFHPEQAADAVAAGKHVYVAKPIAVDVPGCQSIAESGKKATEAKKVFLVDFQTRAHPTYRELMTRVKSGAIGTLIGADAHYPWSGIVADVPTPTPEDRLRSWYGVLALSGDCIVEQDIHALDVACWFAGSDPIKAYGTGGKAIRKHGQIWDHFALTFVYPNDFEVTFSSHKGTPGVKDEISVRAFGTEGLALTDYYGPVQIAGKNPFPGATMTDMYAAGTKVNIAEFREAVKSGDCANATVPESVRSNLTCVLGRTAAYRGKEVTLSEILGSAEKLEADLQGLKS